MAGHGSMPHGGVPADLEEIRNSRAMVDDRTEEWHVGFITERRSKGNAQFTAIIHVLCEFGTEVYTMVKR
jgi:hypothetical protein